MTNCSHLSSVGISQGLAALNKLSMGLRVLENTKSTAYHSFRGPQKSWAQLKRDSSEFVSASKRKSWDSVSVSMSILGGEIVPRLQLTAMVGNENRKRIHEDIVEDHANSSTGR